MNAIQTLAPIDLFAPHIEAAARAFCGPVNARMSTPTELRFRANGSISVSIGGPKQGVWSCFDLADSAGVAHGGVLDLLRVFGRLEKPEAIEWLRRQGAQLGPKPAPAKPQTAAIYDYRGADGLLLFQVLRLEPKSFRQRRPDGNGGWSYKLDDVKRVPYRLPELLAAPSDAHVFVAEGEKDVDRLRHFGLRATCNAGGAGKWLAEFAVYLEGRQVVILPDHDEAGERHGLDVAAKIIGSAQSVRVLRLPGLPPKGDVSDWLDAGGTPEALHDLVVSTTPSNRAAIELPVRPSPAAMELEPTEDAVAQAFALRYRQTLRYDHTSGLWHEWDGASWRPERTRLAFEWARKLCREVADAKDYNFGIRSTLAKAVTAGAVERFAQSDRAFAVTSEIWDADPYLLGTPGGTLDLRTGAVRRASSNDFITRLTAVAPAETAACPRWLAFLDDATGGDADLIRFLRSWCGYALTGTVQEHALLFIYGPGGNGKSVFLNTISNLLGDYAKVAAMETFTAASGDRHPTDLAMLAGARMVSVSETEEGAPWAETRIKQLTGGDPISARFMRRDFFTYLPAFKLTIVGNHQPQLRNVDDAARRRFNVVPFTRKPAQPDRDLEAKLRAEWPAILRWSIDGALEWQRAGLVRPTAVKAATADYFSEQDSVAQWLEEQCETGGRHLSETVGALFESWRTFALANGEKPGTAKWISQTLARHGFEAVKNTPGFPGRRGFLRIAVKRPDLAGQWQNASDR